MVWKCEWDNSQCVPIGYTTTEPNGNSITQ